MTITMTDKPTDTLPIECCPCGFADCWGECYDTDEPVYDEESALYDAADDSPHEDRISDNEQA